MPYVRILYAELPEEKRTNRAAPGDPHPIMIVSFILSTRKMDQVDDLVCLTHLSIRLPGEINETSSTPLECLPNLNCDFVHGELGFASMHGVFAKLAHTPP